MKTLNLETAADFLNISADTMRDLAADGTVPGAKIGKCWVFTDEDLDAYVRDEVRRQTAERRGGKLSAPIPTAFTRSVRRKAMTPPPLR
ncbi:MAG: helix-turn-helix domain-containing protein [Azonexus sp.]